MCCQQQVKASSFQALCAAWLVFQVKSWKQMHLHGFSLLLAAVAKLLWLPLSEVTAPSEIVWVVINQWSTSKPMVHKALHLFIILIQDGLANLIVGHPGAKCKRCKTKKNKCYPTQQNEINTQLHGRLRKNCPFIVVFVVGQVAHLPGSHHWARPLGEESKRIWHWWLIPHCICKI